MSSVHDPFRDADPSLFFGNGNGRRTDWKARRLCRQVSEALQTGLAGECSDEVLQQVHVVSVDPAPDASRMAVTVTVSDRISPVEAMIRLERARGLLRSIVARAIHRKKVPELVFLVAGPEEEDR